MRQGQLRVVQGKIVIGEQIDVDGARTPSALVRSVAAERALDDCARASRLRRRPVRARCRVGERRLVGDARARDSRRARDEPHVPPSQSIATARSSVARTSPRLPPSDRSPQP